MDELLVRLQPVFRDIFGDSSLVISPESNAGTVEGWDSITHISLVSAVEQEFGIRFALGELEKLNNVGEMVALMHKKLGR